MASRTELVHVTAWFFEEGDQLVESDAGWIEDLVIDGRKDLVPLDEADPLIEALEDRKEPEEQSPKIRQPIGSSLRAADPDYAWRAVRSFVGLEPATVPIGHGGDDVWISSWIDYDIEQIGADEVWHDCIDGFPAACTEIALQLRKAREAALSVQGVPVSGIKAMHFLVVVDCLAGPDDDGVDYTFQGLLDEVKTAHGAQRELPNPQRPAVAPRDGVTVADLMSMPNYERIALSPRPKLEDSDKAEG